LLKISFSTKLITLNLRPVSHAGEGTEVAKEKEYFPNFLYTDSSPKSTETNRAAQDREEIKHDDTGTFRRYLKLADQLLSTDKKDDDPGSSAA
jgi:hypothetical protein